MAESSRLAQMVVDQQMLAADAVAKVEAAAKKAGKRLGDALLDANLLDATQVEALRAGLRELFESDDDPIRKHYRDEALQGRMLINWEMASNEQVREAFEEKLLRAAEGVEQPLGEVMVELGFLTPFQQYKLQTQQHVVMVCPADQTRYNVMGYENGLRLKCPACKGWLEKTNDAPAGSGAKPLVFDRAQAEELALLGRLAVGQNMVTREQLAQAVRQQGKSKPGTSIGKILKQMNFLSGGQLSTLEKEMKRLGKTKKDGGDGDEPSFKIGAIGLQKGYYDEATLEAVVADQAAKQAKGEAKRLGEMLIAAGFLTSFQLVRMLSFQSKTIVACTECGTQLNVHKLPEDAQPKCPKCGAAMEVPDKVETVEALRTMNFNLSDLVAIEADAPKRDMRESLPSIGTKRGTQQIVKDALEGTKPPGTPATQPAGVKTDVLDQTMSLLNFAGGAGPELRKKIDGAALAEWVKQCLKRQPLWQVLAPGGHWFCPFCGTAGAKPEAGSKDYVQPIVGHLSRRCEVFNAVGQPPLFPVGELKRRASYLWVKDRMARDAAWNVRDRSNRWVCPYTLRTTDIDLSAGRVSKQAFDAIVTHLTKLPDFSPGKATQPRDKIIAEVAQRYALGQLTKKVEGLVAKNRTWQVADAKGFWSCPYCKTAITSIKADTPLELTVNSPAKIARHLLIECAPFAAKQQPEQSATALKETITGEARAVERHTVAVAPPVNLQAEVGRELDETKRQLEEQMDRMSKDLHRAVGKTAAMLPPMPVIPGLELFVHFKPLEELGGDFYDFIKLPGGEIGLAIGDVSGHGVDAAVVMSMAKKTLKMVARTSTSPKSALVLTNEEILQELDGRTFVTIWYAMLDPATWTLRYARAGHEPLLLFNPARSPALQALVVDGMTAGITSGSKYESIMREGSVVLKPGDIGVLYTDGISEVANKEKDQFGRKRIEAVLRNCAGATPEEVVGSITTALEAFRGGPVDDDQTIIAFRRT